MALFKIHRGPETNLNSQPVHDGYAWFTKDKHNLYIDVDNERVQINAYAADVLLQTDITGAVIKEIDVDDLLLKEIAVTVEQGGTGHQSLTSNALLLGNGTDPIKLVSLTTGGVLLSDKVDGVKELKGVGALFAQADKMPEFGVLPIEAGGTGGTTQSSARQKLDVYSKSETDNIVSAATTVAYTTTLSANQWTNSGSEYTYNYANADLACGKAHNVPPLITYTSNQVEYSKIKHAEATPGTGIVFTMAEQPIADIGLIIIDVN